MHHLTGMDCNPVCVDVCIHSRVRIYSRVHKLMCVRVCADTRVCVHVCEHICNEDVAHDESRICTFTISQQPADLWVLFGLFCMSVR